MATEPPQHVAPPMLLSRPADAPPVLEPLRGTEVIRSLHLDWARIQGTPSGPATPWHRLTRKIRRSLPFGAADRELIGALIRGVDLIATRCDEMADRLATTETLTSEVTRSFGQDITHLRADLMTLQAALDHGALPDR